MTDPELGDHICQPFRTIEDQLSSTVDFVRSGMARSRSVVVFTHTIERAAMSAWLESQVDGFAEAVTRGSAPMWCRAQKFTWRMADSIPSAPWAASPPPPRRRRPPG